MQDTDGLEKSRQKIEALERHARWFIEEHKAGRILHFKDEEDLEAQGFMRTASHLVLRDEVFRLADTISDEDLTFLQSFADKDPGAEAPDRDEDQAKDRVADDTQEAQDNSDADLMEDAISEIVSLNGSEHKASSDSTPASSMFAHLASKAD